MVDPSLMRAPGLADPAGSTWKGPLLRARSDSQWRIQLETGGEGRWATTSESNGCLQAEDSLRREVVISINSPDRRQRQTTVVFCLV